MKGHPEVGQEGHPLIKFLPNGATFAALVAALAATLASEARWLGDVTTSSLQDLAVHVAVGAGCGISVLATIYLTVSHGISPWSAETGGDG